MSNQSIGYIRVSTREQSTGRQSDGMESLKLDKIFTEKASGKSKERPELRLCIDYAREGDTVYIYRVKPLGNEDVFSNRIFRTMPVKGPFTFVVISDSNRVAVEHFLELFFKIGVLGELFHFRCKLARIHENCRGFQCRNIN